MASEVGHHAARRQQPEAPLVVADEVAQPADDLLLDERRERPGVPDVHALLGHLREQLADDRHRQRRRREVARARRVVGVQLVRRDAASGTPRGGRRGRRVGRRRPGRLPRRRTLRAARRSRPARPWPARTRGRRGSRARPPTPRRAAAARGRPGRAVVPKTGRSGSGCQPKPARFGGRCPSGPSADGTWRGRGTAAVTPPRRSGQLPPPRGT